MDPGILNVLAYCPEFHLAVDGYGVDLKFLGVSLELRDHYRMIRGHPFRATQDLQELRRLIRNVHGRAAEDVARAHEQRKSAQIRDHLSSLGHIGQPLPKGLLDAKLIEQLPKLRSILRTV